MENKADQVQAGMDDQLPFTDQIPFKMVMLPVAEEDYEKLNQFAEALMLTRYPAKVPTWQFL